MKPRKSIYVLICFPVLIAGCRYGEDRTDIRGNGQGGINVQYVPNTQAPEPAPQPAPQNATATDPKLTQQQQIEQLQSQLRQQDEEIRRLKALPPAPATQP